MSDMINEAMPLYELLFNPFLPHTINLVAVVVWAFIGIYLATGLGYLISCRNK